MHPTIVCSNQDTRAAKLAGNIPVAGTEEE